MKEPERTPEELLHSLCGGLIFRKQITIPQNKWYREYTTVYMNGSEYQCQLSIRRKDKHEEQG